MNQQPLYFNAVHILKQGLAETDDVMICCEIEDAIKYLESANLPDTTEPNLNFRGFPC